MTCLQSSVLCTSDTEEKTGPRNHNILVSDCYPIEKLRKEIIDTFEKKRFGESPKTDT